VAKPRGRERRVQQSVTRRRAHALHEGLATSQVKASRIAGADGLSRGHRSKRSRRSSMEQGLARERGRAATSATGVPEVRRVAARRIKGKKTPPPSARVHRSGQRRRETPPLRVRRDGSGTIDAWVLVVSVMGSKGWSDASRARVSASRKANRITSASPRKARTPLAWPLALPKVRRCAKDRRINPDETIQAARAA